jgi:hypothetical protein
MYSKARAVIFFWSTLKIGFSGFLNGRQYNGLRVHQLNFKVGGSTF